MTPASTRFQEVNSSHCSMEIPICTVLIVSRFVMSKGHKYRFQACRNAYTPRVAKPGLLKGSAMEK